MRDTSTLIRTRTILQSELRLRISGLREVILCARRLRTSSDRCVWNFHNLDTTFSVSFLLVANLYMYIFINLPNSACLGREAQAREAREIAPVNPHTWQLSKARSRHLNRNWAVHHLWSRESLFFAPRGSSGLYNKSYPFLTSWTIK